MPKAKILPKWFIYYRLFIISVLITIIKINMSDIRTKYELNSQNRKSFHNYTVSVNVYNYIKDKKYGKHSVSINRTPALHMKCMSFNLVLKLNWNKVRSRGRISKVIDSHLKDRVNVSFYFIHYRICLFCERNVANHVYHCSTFTV